MCLHSSCGLRLGWRLIWWVLLLLCALGLCVLLLVSGFGCMCCIYLVVWLLVCSRLFILWLDGFVWVWISQFVAYLVGGCVSRILLVVGLLAAVGGVDCVWFICCVMLGLCVDSAGLTLIVLLALVYV